MILGDKKAPKEFVIPRPYPPIDNIHREGEFVLTQLPPLNHLKGITS